ncbi:MAG TPA: hypothetical protein GX510_03280 [Firmicutes bacterium]|nr:hypothetical protein [Candidatus Fermentithermobacillaceae bacterium]
MLKDLSEFELIQLFMEARYPDALLFLDTSKRVSMAHVLQKMLPLYKLESQFVHLANPEKQIEVTIFVNRALVGMQEVTNYTFFRQTCEKVFRLLGENLQVDSVDRLGVRFFWGYPVKDVRVASELVQERLLKSTAFNVFSDFPLENVSVSFTTKIDTFNARLSIGNMTIEKVLITMGPATTSGSPVIERKQYLLADVDLFVTNLKLEDARLVPDRAYQSSRKVLDGLVQSLNVSP